MKANKNLYSQIEPDVTLKFKNHQRTQGVYWLRFEDLQLNICHVRLAI